ncbi:MAG: acyl-CoA dehydrogenase family protein [Candidatus Latescibacterota bacterium]|nr:acyl-CoA dehydrogenase family protein [Candidatus Latescibacterota bacterium]
MNRITHPAEPAMAELCLKLGEMSEKLETPGSWPGEQLQLCAEAGVFEWFVSEEFGGQGWDDADITRGYLALSGTCLTTTFVLTQLTGAVRRIQSSENLPLRDRMLPDLLRGEHISTLGVSHLTTSRRHLGRPAMGAVEAEDGYIIEGLSAWVTGAPFADSIVMGAEMEDGRQILVALPIDLPGVRRPEATQLVALTASLTSSVHCDGVHVLDKQVLAGPREAVLSQGRGGAGTGGLQTTTLAIGLAESAVAFTEREAKNRKELLKPSQALRHEVDTLQAELLDATSGSRQLTTAMLRARANSLVLRATQVSLAAAKGTGYAAGHPAGRWCREALFFLVWSCPQEVIAENLCELAGVAPPS